ncbi:MAG TPA: DNA mismatch repair protein MutS, partial [Spirochaetes bacterium]|nr:DNA mismatch repair protein MutS [Spirochaetota bacterium]
MESTTPMMKQFNDIKDRYCDEILFFRMGDFYEMFGEDAEKASKVLDITLTKRNNIPMCGIPHHAKENYLFKLIKAGYKVAICDQLEDPSTAKGIVKRGVTEVITPGTLIDDRLLDQMGQSQNNYIMALQMKAKSPTASQESDQTYTLGLAYLDLSTGDFMVYEDDENNIYQAITDRLYQISPKELILPESLKENQAFQKLLAKDQKETIKNYLADYRFDPKQGESILLESLKVTTLKGFGIEKKPLAIGLAGSLLYYLKEIQLRDVSHLSTIHSIEKSQSMELNESTLRNLELTSNIQDGTGKHTFLSALNKCKTSMGSRKLRRWILQPLLNAALIKQRQEIVSFFFHDGNLLLETQNYLDRLMDVERLLGKIALNKA